MIQHMVRSTNTVHKITQIVIIFCSMIQRHISCSSHKCLNYIHWIFFFNASLMHGHGTFSVIQQNHTNIALYITNNRQLTKRRVSIPLINLWALLFLFAKAAWESCLSISQCYLSEADSWNTMSNYL